MAKATAHACTSVQLTIAGIGIELTWEGARLTEEPTLEFYRRFRSNGHADVRLQVHCGKLPPLRPEEMLFDAIENHWRLWRLNGRYLFEIFDTLPPHPMVQLASMAPDFSAGEVYLKPEKTAREQSFSLTQLMRPFGELLLTNLLSQGRGVMLHGLAVSDQGEGLLFIGESGAGKTTLANLYKPHKGVSILSDERVVVTQIGGQFWLSGTPWPGGGFTVSAETVPLRMVFFLEHGTCNELIADRLINLSGLFFQQLFLPFWNGEALGFALSLAEELLSTVPSSRLSFVNDPQVIEFLRRQR